MKEKTSTRFAKSCNYWNYTTLHFWLININYSADLPKPATLTYHFHSSLLMVQNSSNSLLSKNARGGQVDSKHFFSLFTWVYLLWDTSRVTGYPSAGNPLSHFLMRCIHAPPTNLSIIRKDFYATKIYFVSHIVPYKSRNFNTSYYVNHPCMFLCLKFLQF